MMLLMILLGFSAVPDNVTEFQLNNGIHVISRTVPHGVVEGISLFLIGGSALLEGSTQGIEAFSLEAALTGSQRFPDHRWREIMDLTLAQWNATYSYDHSRYHLKCLSEDLPILLDGFSDCLLNPQLDPGALSRVRSSMEASLLTELQEPDNMVWLTCNRGFMGEGHPYMLRPEGYPSTVASFNAEDVRSWLNRRIRAGNILLVHAGPTTPGQLQGILEQTFGRIPGGEDTIPEVPAFGMVRDTMILEHRETLTAYCVVKFEAPPAGHPDHAPFTIACRLIDELLWQVLRTDNALTYATYAGATDHYRRNWGYMYVSTERPSEAAVLIAEVFRQVASGDINQSLLTGVANNYRTLQGIRGQSMDTQCQTMGSGYLAAGDWSFHYGLQDSLRTMTVEEVSGALSRWAGPGGWGIIADSGLVDFRELEPLPLKGE